MEKIKRPHLRGELETGLLAEKGCQKELGNGSVHPLRAGQWVCSSPKEAAAQDALETLGDVQRLDLRGTLENMARQ